MLADWSRKSSSKAKDKMKSALLLDVVVRQCTTILKLLACKDQALLIRWNSFLVLNLCLDVVNSVAGLNIQGNGLASQRFYKDLHSSTEAKHQMESALFLDVVVRQCAAILELLACKDQAL